MFWLLRRSLSKPKSAAAVTVSEGKGEPDQAHDTDADSPSLAHGMTAGTAVLSRSLSTAVAPFAFGGGAATVPKLSRSVTGFLPLAQPFAFGTAPPAFGSTGQLPLQFGMSKAALAGNAAGQLFGFAAPATAKALPSFGTAASGGLGSAFGAFQQTSAVILAPVAAAAAGAAGAIAVVQEVGESGAAVKEADSVAGSSEEDAAEDEAGDEEDGSHFALPDDLLSDSEGAAGGSMAETADAAHLQLDENAPSAMDEQEEEDAEEGEVSGADDQAAGGQSEAGV